MGGVIDYRIKVNDFQHKKPMTKYILDSYHDNNRYFHFISLKLLDFSLKKGLTITFCSSAHFFLLVKCS